jgi:predicted signal transduction protein with EAL and GGDEF domain
MIADSGDEFVIFLEDIQDVRDATRVANRIHEELVSPFNLAGNEVFTSTSIGIALSLHRYDRPEDACAMQTAVSRQGAGRRGMKYSKSMHDRAVALLSWKRICGGPWSGGLQVHYQPVYRWRLA